MSAHKVIGAAWCGYSKKQFEELGCSGEATDGGTTTCQAKTADGNPIQFTWCMNDKNEKINQSLPECQQQTNGYPAWIGPDGTPSKDIQGFMPACAVNKQFPDVLENTGLKCDEQEAARGKCESLMKTAEAKDDVKAKIEELKTATEAAKKEVQAFTMEKTTVLNRLNEEVKTMIEPEMQQCKEAIESAKPFQ